MQSITNFRTTSLAGVASKRSLKTLSTSPKIAPSARTRLAKPSRLMEAIADYHRCNRAEKAARRAYNHLVLKHPALRDFLPSIWIGETHASKGPVRCLSDWRGIFGRDPTAAEWAPVETALKEARIDHDRRRKEVGISAAHDCRYRAKLATDAAFAKVRGMQPRFPAETKAYASTVLHFVNLRSDRPIGNAFHWEDESQLKAWIDCRHEAMFHVLAALTHLAAA